MTEARTRQFRPISLARMMLFGPISQSSPMTVSPLMVVFGWMTVSRPTLTPSSTYVEEGVSVGRDTVIHPNTTISGETVIGEDCEIGPNSIIRASEIGRNCRVLASVIENSVIESGVSIGPFSHVRDGAHIETGAYLGNYAE